MVLIILTVPITHTATTHYYTDHYEVCKVLGVDRYPSIYYIGYGNLNQAPIGNPFGKSELPRVAR